MSATDTVGEAYNRGFQLRCEGKYREAKLAFGEVLRINPRHLDARWQMGLIQGFEGDFDGSLSTLQNLANENPREAKVLNDLAMTQQMLGYEDEAAENFRRVLAIEPGHENATKQLSYYQ